MEYTAFDYTAQRWITGEPARLLLISQQREVLALATGPKGADYCRMIGERQDIVIDSARRALKDCGASVWDQVTA